LLASAEIAFLAPQEQGALRATARWISLLAVAVAYLTAPGSRADNSDPESSPAVHERPEIQLNRWQEDWSVLADPQLRTEPLDNLKYIPLSSSDPNSYASLGLDLRERVESSQIAPFGIGNPHANTYLIQRLDFFADVHPNANWQIFVQLQDDQAYSKDIITPVDKDPLDLEQAFVSYSNDVAGGTLKVRVGRQQMAFDLQRFIGVRDGPNVRQSFDAVWVDWERSSWRFITFWSHPVQDVPDETFNDYSSRAFQYGGVRIERDDVGPGKLSAYYSRYDMDAAHYLDASGNERRDNIDLRYAIARGPVDWDLEGMRQTGRVGNTEIRAWAVGSRGGYTFKESPWSPRIGLQVDLASGDQWHGDRTLGTFNPLFPNAYYFTLASTPTYANLIHVRPSLEVRPLTNLKIIGALGLQWRQTTSDAVYVIPDRPVAGTAGQPGRWTGKYEQLRAEWAITRHWAAAVEGVQYQVGDVIRRAGGLNANYLGIELRFSW
jgi:alginate export protein